MRDHYPVSGLRGRRGANRAIAIGIVLVLGLGACIDEGYPPTEEQLRSLGLPVDTLMTVNGETQAMVRLKDGAPELLIFDPYGFGGSEMTIWMADRPSIDGGRVGGAYSLGPFSEASRAHEPGYRYLFGAGQGPIERVVVDEPEARTQIVNPEIDGWVIVVSETIGVGALGWQLIGPDGAVVYESVGIGLPDTGLKVDEDTRATVRVRDGTPELLVYTPNAFGGAQMAVWPADHPTVNGGLVGTATSPGYRYLFGAGQGPLKRLAGAKAEAPEARAQVVDDEIGGWVIAVPEPIAIDDLDWSLVGPDGAVLYEGVGLEPRQR